MDLGEFVSLQKEVDRLKRDLAKAEAVVEQGEAAVAEASGCVTEGEARKLLAKKEKEAKELDTRYQRALAEYRDKWGEKLDG